MSLYIVHRKNPFFKNGAIIELFTEGFQECVVDRQNGRMKVQGHTGLFMPEREVKPYVMRLLRKGLDKPGLRRKAEYS